MLDIRRAGPDDLETLANLLQLYLYDLADLEPRPMNTRARFQHPGPEAYLSEPRAAFLVTALGRPAAFALVGSGSALSPEAGNVRSIDDFFVLRGLRRRGLGRLLALQVLRALPGRWEVRQSAANTPAQAFWRAVIGEYTGGRYVEVELDDQRWHGPVQAFDNSLWVG